jgi:hypothetical protein
VVLHNVYWKGYTLRTAIFLKFYELLFHKDYTTWMDNYYNSPGLAKFLNPCNTDSAGTVKINRKNMSKKAKSYRCVKLYCVAQ